MNGRNARIVRKKYCSHELGRYQTFEDYLQERDICLKPAELCRETGQSVEEMAF